MFRDRALVYSSILTRRRSDEGRAIQQGAPQQPLYQRAPCGAPEELDMFVLGRCWRIPRSAGQQRRLSRTRMLPSAVQIVVSEHYAVVPPELGLGNMAHGLVQGLGDNSFHFASEANGPPSSINGL